MKNATTIRPTAKPAEITVEIDDDDSIVIKGLSGGKEGRKQQAKNIFMKQGAPEEIAEQYAEEVVNGTAIRQLNAEEKIIYGGAIVNITNIMPAYRDAIAHLRPYLDLTADTAYVDQYSRMGVSPWWLYGITTAERGAVLLHESMHVMNDHMQRYINAAHSNRKQSNYAGDMEINTTIQRAPGVKLPDIVIYPELPPYHFEKGLSYEKYYALLDDHNVEDDQSGGGGECDGNCDGSKEQSEDGNGTCTCGGGDQNGDQSGGGSSGGQGQNGDQQDGQGGGGNDAGDDGHGSCDSSSDARSAAADEAGVEQSSTSEQTIIKAATAAKIQDELAKSRAAGSGHLDEFYRMAHARMYRPVSDWRAILKRVSSRVMDAIAMGRSDYSYRRTNRRMNGGRYIFPGMVQYKPSVMLGVDISGSMQEDDQIKTVGEAEALLKELDKGSRFRVFSVDTHVGKIKTVQSVKNLSFYGGGGTAMEVAYEFVMQLPKKERPDFFVLATDGGTDWDALLREAINASKMGIASAILVTTEYGHREYKAAAQRIRVPRNVHIIDCSQEINK